MAGIQDFVSKMLKSEEEAKPSSEEKSTQEKSKPETEVAPRPDKRKRVRGDAETKPTSPLDVLEAEIAKEGGPVRQDDGLTPDTSEEPIKKHEFAEKKAPKEDETLSRSEEKPSDKKGSATDVAVAHDVSELTKKERGDLDAKLEADELRSDRGQTRFNFEGKVLTIEGGPLRVAPEQRALCVMFDTGLFLVSRAHKNSPLVRSVYVQAKRSGYRVKKTTLVTPDIIQKAYEYAGKSSKEGETDDNAIRRKIVETLAEAVKYNANDIHIMSNNGRAKVEFRVDGRLQEWQTWTQKEGDLFVAAVWSHCTVQSGATPNWLEPQAAMLAPTQGADAVEFPPEVMAVRCQWVPLAGGGRYLDMRLQYDGTALMGEEGMSADVDILGMNPQQTDLVRHLRAVPGGMRLIAAPVNQGKTTTLRLMLNKRMLETDYELNLLMIEDPPEGGVIGAREIGISAAHGDEQRDKTFTEIMRSALRLDPDLVMLGETRDLTTATFLFRLALTGRQVYSTIHVYSALAIPQRLRDLGVESYLCYDEELVKGMISQRLVRTVCPHCAVPLTTAVNESQEYEDIARRLRAAVWHMHAERYNYDDVSEEDFPLEEPDFSQVLVANIEGCDHCKSGRIGRTLCAEVIETDAKLMELLSQDKVREARSYWLSPNGMKGIDMKWHGIDKALTGMIAIDDLESEFGPMANLRTLEDFEAKFGKRNEW